MAVQTMIYHLLITVVFGLNSIDQQLCIMDTQRYHETAIITNICVDLIEEYNMSFRINCDANSVTYSEYSDPECQIERRYGLPDGEDLFRIDEGCDDPFDLNAYVQISECDDANYNGGGSRGKVASHNYTDCEWFGSNTTNAPISPVGVCTAYSHLDELNHSNLYSAKLECDYINGVMLQYEYNNTECSGTPYHVTTFQKGIDNYLNIPNMLQTTIRNFVFDTFSS